MRFATQAVTAAAAVGVAVAASSAFTASNTVPVSNVGQGASVSSGYAVTAVDYTLASASDVVTAVDFTLSPTDGTADAARSARARLRSGDPYVDCTVVSGAVWTCPFPTYTVPLTAAAAISLDVVAAG